MDDHFLISVSLPDQAPGLRRIALALDLPEDADEGAIVARIEAVRLLRQADSLHQVRAALGLAVWATPLDCAAELCRRLPAGYAPAVIVAMQCVEANERLRQARVALICADAIREARDAR